MGPEFLDRQPLNFTGRVKKSNSWRKSLYDMWTELAKEEEAGEPHKVNESGALESGDAIFFNPLHLHRGPQRPFPPLPAQTQSQRAASKRPVVAPARLTDISTTKEDKRRVIFMAFVPKEGKASSEKCPIFAIQPPNKEGSLNGKVWHAKDAFNMPQEERDEHEKGASKKQKIE